MTTSLKSRRPFIAATVIAVLIAGGTAVAMSAQVRGSETVSPVADAPSSSTSGAAGAMQDPILAGAGTTRTAATAIRVEIPAIGVDAPLEQLPIDVSTGVLTPPVEWMSAGWYRDGTVPGDVGPAVIAGHRDSITKPAVFARLDELVAGNEIRVTLSTGDTKTFVVDTKSMTPKDAFPTDDVYGPTPNAQLRLITCAGIFNAATGHYLDNLIVFANLKA